MTRRTKLRLPYGMALMGVAGGIGLAGGCSPLSLGLSPSASPSPTAPCYLVVQTPAPIFFVKAPEAASPDATFSITAWVYLGSGSWGTLDTLLPETFQASVDSASKSITVSGLVKRLNYNPDAHCEAIPMIMPMPTGATVSVVTSAPSGSYLIAVPSANFYGEAPVGRPDGPTYPTPAATRSIVIR